MGSLDAIRAKLAAAEAKASGQSRNTNTDNTLFQHWNLEEGQTATVRFLPDGDPDNVFFWAERLMIRLPFPGVKGAEDENRGVTVQVPCGEMYGDACPVLTEIRPWFKDPTLEDQARTYWKKYSYIFQGFVTDNPINEDNPPENPIRRFVINKQIFNLIKDALMDPDMEDIPTDYTSGTDFIIKKTAKGQYADYTTSKWARKERALTEDELAAIDEYGLNNLKDFLPERPSPEHYQVIMEMFEASVNGDLYDPERWGNFYKPYGVEVPANAAQPGLQKTEAPKAEVKPKPAKKAEPVAETQDDDGEIPFETNEQAAAKEAEPAGGASKSADDILAMLRKRKQNEA